MPGRGGPSSPRGGATPLRAYGALTGRLTARPGLGKRAAPDSRAGPLRVRATGMLKITCRSKGGYSVQNGRWRPPAIM